ncbi:MAG: DNA-binding protein [Candidatus Aenigmarchaeota archaeon]|nr:DNA-binding protein [Candidatus Aenigmarchaeota archaeon]
MKFKKIDGRCIIKISKGEKIVESVLKFCSDNKVKSGAFYGIGAADDAELMVYHSRTKNYSSKVFRGDMEILSIIGNVAFLDSKQVVHVHITLSDANGKAFGGHLKEAVVSGACEIVFIEFKAGLARKHDSETGLNLLDI